MRATGRRRWGSGQKRSRRWEAPGPMRTSFSSTKSRGWALSWPGTSCSWPTILRISPRQNRKENRTQEQETQREADTLPEIHRDVVQHDDRDDEADDGNEVEENPPHRLAGDLDEHDHVINGDDRSPTGLACLLKHLPHRGRSAPASARARCPCISPDGIPRSRPGRSI